jgi:hypothetical protein
MRRAELKTSDYIVVQPERAPSGNTPPRFALRADGRIEYWRPPSQDGQTTTVSPPPAPATKPASPATQPARWQLEFNHRIDWDEAHPGDRFICAVDLRPAPDRPARRLSFYTVSIQRGADYHTVDFDVSITPLPDGGGRIVWHGEVGHVRVASVDVPLQVLVSKAFRLGEDRIVFPYRAGDDEGLVQFRLYSGDAVGCRVLSGATARESNRWNRSYGLDE